MSFGLRVCDTTSELVLGLPGEEDNSATERIETYLSGGKEGTVEVSVHSEGSTTPTTPNTISSIDRQPAPLDPAKSQDLLEVLLCLLHYIFI